jgi:hypothetical protein
MHEKTVQCLEWILRRIHDLSRRSADPHMKEAYQLVAATIAELIPDPESGVDLIDLEDVGGESCCG